MKNFYLSCLLAFSIAVASGQNIGIGTSNPQNKLHVAGGFRLDTLVSGTDSGLLRHDNSGVVYSLKFTGSANDVLRGNGSFAPVSAGWSLTGNAGTSPATNFIGTTDNQPLVFKMNDQKAGRIDANNLFFGFEAGNSNTASFNTGIGKGALYVNSTGSENTALGFSALFANSTAIRNTAVGSFALSDNTTGHRNSAIGSLALTANTTGAYNTANGCAALYTNTTGSESTATGYGSLFNNSTGYGNTANGFASMYSNQLGFYNTAIGHTSLYSNITGQYNVAGGYFAMSANSYGSYNAASGANALRNNIGGANNTAMGYSTLSSNEYGNNNTAVGYGALNSNINGGSNTAIGASSGLSGSSVTNATALGANAYAGASNLMAFGSGDVTKWVFGRNNVSDVNYALQVGTSATNGNGAYLTNGGTWTNTSDKYQKEAFSFVNGKEVLDKLRSLQVMKWKYKNTNEYHIGPTAQDFYSLFQLGLNDKGISTIDPAGILLIAVKEQQKQIEDLKKEIDQLKGKRN